MEADRPASPPPLLAYTASQLKDGRGGDALRRGKATSATGKARSKIQAAPRFRKNEQPVVFDEDARREYLTGFRKRKQARIEHGRERARLREKEDRRKMREDARQAKKQQAAENVRAERQAYGGDEASDQEQMDENGVRPPSPSAFETEEHHTTVTVQAWDPEADFEAPESSAAAAERQEGKRKPPKAPSKDVLPPSSRRMAKKLKSEDAERQRERQRKQAGGKGVSRNASNKPLASSISELLDDGAVVAETTPADDRPQAVAGESHTGRPPSKKPFRYESKLDRAKARAAQHEANAKFAQKRKEAAMQSGGRKPGAKGRSGGRGGKGGKARGGKR